MRWYWGGGSSCGSVDLSEGGGEVDGNSGNERLCCCGGSSGGCYRVGGLGSTGYSGVVIVTVVIVIAVMVSGQNRWHNTELVVCRAGSTLVEIV